MSLEEKVFDFLDHHYQQKPVLLALSGGSDSLALFHLLKAYQEKKTLIFGVAHIDHGWRQESEEEAKQIGQLAQEKQVQFHLKRLDPVTIKGNLEQACRLERLAFFSEICRTHGYQAVIIAHHADDQTETVLKKVLEGRSLPYLKGMSALSKYQNLTIWRPLLGCSKNQILSWLQKKELKAFEDATNFDEKFLRARLRHKIIPNLSQDFGKEISSSLTRLGQESNELKNYLDRQLTKKIAQIIRGPFGSFLDLSDVQEDFELRYLIRKACEEEGMYLSHALIDQACLQIRKKTANRRLIAKDRYVYIDRGKIFITKKVLQEFISDIPLKMGRYSIDNWDIEVKESGEPFYPTGWQEAWQGHLRIQLPQGKYFLKRGNASFSDRWTDAKVPAFLRWVFPVVWSEEKAIHEFLTGRLLNNFLLTNQKGWLISIDYCKEK